VGVLSGVCLIVHCWRSYFPEAGHHSFQYLSISKFLTLPFNPKVFLLPADGNIDGTNRTRGVGHRDQKVMAGGEAQ